MNIIGRKNLYFVLSLIVIVPGIISLLLFGLKLSIDFTGGSRMTLLFNKSVSQDVESKIRETFKSEKVEVATIQKSGNQKIIRTEPLSTEKHETDLAAFTKTYKRV